MKKIKVGFVGVGCISPIYLENLTKLFKEVEIAGVCDLIRERAEKAVAEYDLPKLYEDMYELLPTRRSTSYSTSPVPTNIMR